MDDDIARLYAERGAANIRPRFTKPLIRLSRRGPMTIRELAEALELTHSAMSQTVAALRKEGFVTTEPGPDARTRAVVLTERAERIIPFLEAEWLATEAAVAELESEVPYSLSQVVADLTSALERKPFRERIEDRISDMDLPVDPST
ncbi:MarR family winged helix-turn-helix transcriptional regulator [Prauserella marina]|nr:MarR family transcriptional regulator [Prauserella marina]